MKELQALVHQAKEEADQATRGYQEEQGRGACLREEIKDAHDEKAKLVEQLKSSSEKYTSLEQELKAVQVKQQAQAQADGECKPLSFGIVPDLLFALAFLGTGGRGTASRRAERHPG